MFRFGVILLLTNGNSSARVCIIGRGRAVEYEFTFIVSGVTVDDDEAVCKLRDEHDAMLVRAGGVDLLTIAFEGVTAVNAAMQAATAVVAVVPKINILRLDRGLVGIPEIAERTDRSRQNVAQWIKGERLSDGPPFPKPEGTAGRSSVWLWTEVNEWLKNRDLDDGCTYPTRGEIADIDHALRHSLTMPLVFDTGTEDEYTDQRQAVIAEMEVNHFSGFLKYLAGHYDVTNSEGRCVVVVAAPDEPAHQVMSRIAARGHDVVLVSETDRFVGMVMSTRTPNKPMEVVRVESWVSTRQWLEQMQEKPTAQFVTAVVDAPVERLAMAA